LLARADEDPVRRRETMSSLSGAATRSLAAHAQESIKVPRIGFPGQTSASHPPIAEFLARLRDLGHVGGIESRWANEDYHRRVALAAEPVHLDIGVLVIFSNSGVVAAKQATKTNPLVIAFSGDAVRPALAESLEGQGANLAGQSFSIPELTRKATRASQRSSFAQPQRRCGVHPNIR
jgi:putative tryptophan/tyrosine transport system substrate-binding protein